MDNLPSLVQDQIRSYLTYTDVMSPEYRHKLKAVHASIKTINMSKTENVPCFVDMGAASNRNMRNFTLRHYSRERKLKTFYLRKRPLIPSGISYRSYNKLKWEHMHMFKRMTGDQYLTHRLKKDMHAEIVYSHTHPFLL